MLTMLQKMEVNTERFVDSLGPVSEVAGMRAWLALLLLLVWPLAASAGESAKLDPNIPYRTDCGQRALALVST